MKSTLFTILILFLLSSCMTIPFPSDLDFYFHSDTVRRYSFLGNNDNSQSPIKFALNPQLQGLTITQRPKNNRKQAELDHLPVGKALIVRLEDLEKSLSTKLKGKELIGIYPTVIEFTLEYTKDENQNINWAKISAVIQSDLPDIHNTIKFKFDNEFFSRQSNYSNAEKLFAWAFNPMASKEQYFPRSALSKGMDHLALSYVDHILQSMKNYK
ncbi:MAG: hypothetical protein KC592_06190 [Nitrospira sp.]|nr:hypothetical protein [Nitrospira sp.]MCW5782012.1 hypothetical protein [Nitrospirales bacterium]